MVEKEIRRNNLIIQGVADQEREDQLETIEKLQARKKRPILIKPRARYNKLEIFKNMDHGILFQKCATGKKTTDILRTLIDCRFSNSSSKI
jgi:hypothetical protein